MPYKRWTQALPPAVSCRRQKKADCAGRAPKSQFNPCLIHRPDLKEHSIASPDLGSVLESWESFSHTIKLPWEMPLVWCWGNRAMQAGPVEWHLEINPPRTQSFNASKYWLTMLAKICISTASDSWLLNTHRMHRAQRKSPKSSHWDSSFPTVMTINRMIGKWLYFINSKLPIWGLEKACFLHQQIQFWQRYFLLLWQACFLWLSGNKTHLCGQRTVECFGMERTSKFISFQGQGHLALEGRFLRESWELSSDKTTSEDLFPPRFEMSWPIWPFQFIGANLLLFKI